MRVATLQQRVQTTMRQREQPRATPNTQNSKFSRSFALWRRFGYRVINLSSERKNRLKTASKCELNVLTKFICVNESHYIILQPQKITKPVSFFPPAQQALPCRDDTARKLNKTERSPLPGGRFSFLFGKLFFGTLDFLCTFAAHSPGWANLKSPGMVF